MAITADVDRRDRFGLLLGVQAVDAGESRLLADLLREHVDVVVAEVLVRLSVVVMDTDRVHVVVLAYLRCDGNDDRDQVLVTDERRGPDLDCGVRRTRSVMEER